MALRKQSRVGRAGAMLWKCDARVLGYAALCALALALTGCASRPETGFLTPVAAGAGATPHTLLVATMRERDARPGTWFNGERAYPLDFARLEVSVPPTHKPGEVEWPSAAPGKAETDFVVRDAAYVDGEKAFVDTLNSQLASRPPGSRKVFLFIHGYNTLFAEGVYRFAQVIHDAKAPAVPVLFTWASRGQLSQHVYDMNSATAARDSLDRTIRLLFASNAEEVNIVAHSMGNWVTVEALRQIKISGRVPQISKLGALILAAPDIDIDVFKSQMRQFGKPKKPFVIVLSKDDKALQASSFIAGGAPRLGADSDRDELAALGAIVLDMTDVKALDSSNHGKFAQLAAVAPQLRAVLEAGVGTPVNPADEGKEVVGGSLQSLLSLPITIVRAPVRVLTGR